MAQVKGTRAQQTVPQGRHGALGLSDEEVIEFYKKMLLSRAIDERVWQLNRQGKAPIAASAQGHEAAQVGFGTAALKAGNFRFFTYYRDLTLKVTLGMTAQEALISFLGREGDPWSGARQFPLQGSYLKLGVIQISNVVAAGLTQAVGYALACRMRREPTVVLVSFGDGATSQGECHEAMNFAGLYKLPVVFLCQNNKFAISVPLQKQAPIQDLSLRAAGYGFPGVIVDGMDVFQSFQATRDAIQRAREGQGPTWLEFKLERFMPHTTDDDDRRYRPREEIEAARQRDPLITMRQYLVSTGLLTEEQAEEMRAQARALVDQATEKAEATPPPDPSTLFHHLYTP